jgi:lipopolysaccharide/colanic/teichoic acid biosynthesis glycosyltransferase/VanZ family protein
MNRTGWFFKFWLPPVVWMAIFFPVGNKALASSLTYEISTAVFRWLFPHASAAAVDIFYVVFRKSLHFIEYGVLAYLLYRAFRGADRRRWSARWALRAGAVAVAYGFLDEYLQSFVPDRKGSSFDWGVDIAGITAVLGAKFLRRNSAGPGPLTGALFLKRPFDVSLSFIGLVLSFPLWLLFGLLIWLQDRGPVFYGQERVGKNGRIFKAMKFRSMIVDAEKGRGAVQAVENDPRVTKIGRILRATAMDELPQLWNIFKGDMSFVGPRALRPNEKEVQGDPDTRAIEDIPGYRQRHAVRPGLTGLTQVYLPGETPRRRKFRYDLLYIRKRTFWLDLKLVFLSFWITFRGKWESRTQKV